MAANIAIENARLAFRNFSGEEGRFNPKGKRNFCVLLDHKIAEELRKDGWNVKELKPRDDDEEPQPFLQVAVSYDVRPPKIFLVTQNNKTLLDEESVGCLDWAELEHVDLVIRPYEWEINGKRGVKAYVKTLYAVLVEDEFESKYYDVPDSACSGLLRNKDEN